MYNFVSQIKKRLPKIGNRVLLPTLYHENGTLQANGSDLVTTDTTQTISGDKTFTGVVDLSGASSFKVPDQMFDAGSNSNGSWIKFPDGTMICWTSGSAVYTTSTAVGGVYTSDVITINYPQPFITPPHNVSLACNWSSGRPWAGLVANWAVDSSGVRVMGYNASNAASVYATIIGRWK